MARGILQWVQDFIVNPLAAVIRGTITPVSADDAENQAEINTTIAEEYSRSFFDDYKELYKVDILADPMAIQKRAIAWEVTANLAYLGMTGAIIAAETVTLGQLDMSLVQLLRTPTLNAYFGTAQRIAETRDDASFIVPLRRYYLKQHTPLLPEAYRLAIAVSKNIISFDGYLEAMAESGFSPEWANIWLEQSEQYPTIETGLALLRRGEITAEIFDLWMSRVALPQSVRSEVVKLAEVIPPLTDLTRIAIREGFGDHSAAVQYPEYEAWAGKMGLSKYFANAYWYAHWDRIALAQMYDNLYRGLWSKEQFLDMLRIKDVHPDDREAIFNVAFNPPSLREMGYGWDTGIYTETDIAVYRRMAGLSPTDAELSAKSMVAYRTEAEREAVRREYMHLFALGKIDEDEYRWNLVRLITAEEAVELWVERGYLEAERKLKPELDRTYRIVTSSEAKWAYVNGLRGVAWYQEKLEALDWTEERVTVAVERATAELAVKGVSARDTEYRNLTSSQIGDLYRLRELSAEQLPNAFMDINYSPEDALMLTQRLIAIEEPEPRISELTRTDIARMYDLKIFDEEQVYQEFLVLGFTRQLASYLTLWTVVNIRYPDLKTQYKNGWITSQQMYDELIQLGLPEERAKELMRMTVKAEQPARIAAERDLTKSEIIKGVKGEILSTIEAVMLLRDLGYEEWEAYYILAINKVVAVGDPESFWDMKRVVEAYKKAITGKSKKIPDELITLELQVKALRKEIAELEAKGIDDVALGERVITLNEVEARYLKVRGEWERSED